MAHLRLRPAPGPGGAPLAADAGASVLMSSCELTSYPLEYIDSNIELALILQV